MDKNIHTRVPLINRKGLKPWVGVSLKIGIFSLILSQVIFAFPEGFTYKVLVKGLAIGLAFSLGLAVMKIQGELVRNVTARITGFYMVFLREEYGVWLPLTESELRKYNLRSTLHLTSLREGLGMVYAAALWLILSSTLVIGEILLISSSITYLMR